MYNRSLRWLANLKNVYWFSELDTVGNDSYASAQIKQNEVRGMETPFCAVIQGQSSVMEAAKNYPKTEWYMQMQAFENEVIE